jgi:hypothetical protein
MKADSADSMSKREIDLILAICLLTGLAVTPTPSLAAALDSPPGPDRYTVITVDYVEYTWWMMQWSNNKFTCEIIADHEGPPTLDEVYRDCSETVYDKWAEQDLCIEGNHTKCKGYYVFEVDKEKKTKEIPAQLPPALVWLTLEDCQPVSSVSTNICETNPKIIVTGQEPLPNETITSVEGTVNGEPFACEGPVCELTFNQTSEDGATLEFWAYSSYGDSSEVFTAQVRVIETDEGDPDQLYWYVDVLSSQWQGQPAATCADSWESFPPVGGPPDWLSTPNESDELSSNIPYTYLAANLILQGVVDASDCPDGGLEAGGGANTCGLEKARPAVTEWQNQFDELIITTAGETSVPAQLLKNLFARESQFWPGIFTIGDVGLGQLTENGADTTFLWNRSFYAQFCPLVLPGEECGSGYLHIEKDQQELLRQALISSVNASCEGCPLGLDLSQADFSVGVFAHTLLANCEQTGRLVRNVSRKAPGDVASFEDLWKFTLVNYNAGPGCLGDALEIASGQGQELTWENVAASLTPACAGAIDYTNDISK